MIRVLIVDDHLLIREGLKKVLSRQNDIQVVGEADEGHATLALVADLAADVLVLDINLPGLSGLEVLSEVRKRHPDLPVLILSIHPEERYALRAFKSGAAGYLTKETAATELVNILFGANETK